MILAYPHDVTVAPGELLRLRVSADAPFRVSLVRCGAVPECVFQSKPFAPHGIAEAGACGVPWDWPVHELELPSSPNAGAYVAVLDDDVQRLDAREASAFIVVRSGVRAPLLVIVPLFTYHAYNVAHVDGTRGEGEGECLYSGATWVTLHRPGGGVGGHPWDEVNRDAYDLSSPRQTFAHWDAKGLAWLERAGYAYDCCTDLDVHTGAVDLREYRAIVSFGHFEYWTQPMRERIDAFIRDGGNAAFFGGNTCWFRLRYDAEQRAIRRDGRWLDNPEWRTTGVTYACGGGKWIGERPPTGYQVREPRHWLFDGTQLAAGDAFGADARLIGYECDGAPTDSDLDVVGEASLRHWDVSDGSGEVSATARASLGVRVANGGSTFTASTVDWARVLHSGDRYVERITCNVLDRFLA